MITLRCHYAIVGYAMGSLRHGARRGASNTGLVPRRQLFSSMPGFRMLMMGGGVSRVDLMHFAQLHPTPSL